MNKPGQFNATPIRLISFIVVAALHAVIILFASFNMRDNVNWDDVPIVAGIMRLVDVEEYIPSPPLPPPPSPEIIPEPARFDTRETIAETMIEIDEEPLPIQAPPSEMGSEDTADGEVSEAAYSIVEETATNDSGEINYFRQHLVSVLPVLPEEDIRRAIVYPPIARRSNIQGNVYLELFIDRQGNVRDVRVLRENPQDRGFAEAAVNAFIGIKGIPAEVNGEPVAVRYRYNLSFTLR
jgi:protein TonB